MSNVMRRPALVALLALVPSACAVPKTEPSGATAAANLEGTESPTAPASRRFEFTYEATLKDAPAESRTAYVWIPCPPSNAHQSIKNTQVVSDMPYEVVTEPRYGNRSFRFRAAPGVALQTATVRFEVERRERVHRPGASPADGPRDGDTGRWLLPDKRVPLDDFVRRSADETVTGMKTALEKARAIYDYTVRELKYDKSGEGWGRGDIYWACDHKRGNCTDFHAVFIGFSRAEGIPARFEIGFPIPRDRPSGEIAGYHCWADFYLDGFGWVPVDASEANKDPSRREYFFGAHDENRMLFTVGRDLTLPGMEGPPLNYFVYPYAEVDGAPYAAVAKRFTFRGVP
jgi:transglutaminase-like putative cysteine protease